jgi:hypothetical protein
LIVEGRESPLRRWDFVHCPQETRHMIVGAGADVETDDPDVAYARYADPEPTRFRDGWLPG